VSWHTVWLFPTGIEDNAGPVIGIDATTGQSIPPQTQNG
jgi:hypothetical protein